MTIIDLRTRRHVAGSRPDPGRPPGRSSPPDERLAGIEVVEYMPAVVHQDVPIVQLVSALNRGGFTLSSVDGRGFVIHRIGDHPERPSKPLPSEGA